MDLVNATRPVWMLCIGLSGFLYAYVVFPVLASLLGLAKRTDASSGAQAGPTEAVTVIIPAYNEEKSIEAKLRNVLATNYPRSLLDILVVSDASTDRTEDIVRAYEAEGVRLVVQERRHGKSAGLNRAIDLARGGLLVFTDANAIYSPAVVGTLVKYFDDPTIGLVTGSTKYALTEGGEVAEVTNIYTALERLIKRAESRWGCCVGADGAIFAMRRSLYRTLRDDDINDFVLPLGVIDQGYRCVFAEDACCSEHPGKSLESEFHRQSRITNRTLRALWRHAHLLNPFRFPLFSFFLFSHKIARFLVPVLLLVSAASLLSLAAAGGVSFVACLGAALIAITVAASNGGRSPHLASRPAVSRLIRLLSAFVTINIAVLHGWWKFLSGHGDVTWQHDRSRA